MTSFARMESIDSMKQRTSVDTLLPPFDSERLRSRLQKLDRQRQLAFGAACCERLLPTYEAFQIDANWGNYRSARQALDLVWSNLKGAILTRFDVRRAIVSCESVAPTSDISDSLYVAGAQDACFAICSLLDHMAEPEVDRIVQAATFATDSVDLYVQGIENMAPNDPALEDKILAHRLMQRELLQQDRDLEAVEQASTIDETFLVELKSSWDNDGKSNLDLPIHR